MHIEREEKEHARVLRDGLGYHVAWLEVRKQGRDWQLWLRSCGRRWYVLVSYQRRERVFLFLGKDRVYISLSPSLPTLSHSMQGMLLISPS